MNNFVSFLRPAFILFQTDYNAFPQTSSSRPSQFSQINSSIKFNFNRFKRFFKNSPYLPFIVVILLVIIVAVFGMKQIMAKTPQVTTNVQSDNRIDIKKPLAQESVNKQFTFPLKDEKGKEVSKIIYTIDSVELRNEIIVKGQKATSIKGRTFLIINLKIANNYNKAISINARDYLRLIINGSTEKLAPDIHNDPVEVQAISVKPTRVGLAINDIDKNIVLQVGEIDGKKETIKLHLQ